MKPKPIRIFYSALSQRFYASRAYKEIKPGIVEITGDKFDVTDELGALIEQHHVTFTRRSPAPDEGQPKGERP